MIVPSSQEFEVKFVSLKRTKPDTKIEGYVGGVYTNKYGKYSLTLYMRQANGRYCCQSLPYSSDLKSGIPYEAKYVILRYKGLVQDGNFSRHTFDIECKTLPETDAVKKFLEKIQAHTLSLDTAPADKKPSAVDALNAFQDEGLPF
jgi:hypothetical protein